MNEHYFAPIPARACMDRRLHACHWAVLSCVAMHARTGRNGLGCLIGREGVAAKTKYCDRRVRSAVKDLKAWGYIEGHPNPKDGRKEMLFARFDGVLDKACVNGVSAENTGSEVPVISGPTVPVSGENSGNGEQDYRQSRAKIPAPQFTHKREIKKSSNGKEIPRSTGARDSLASPSNSGSRSRDVLNRHPGDPFRPQMCLPEGVSESAWKRAKQRIFDELKRRAPELGISDYRDIISQAGKDKMRLATQAEALMKGTGVELLLQEFWTPAVRKVSSA